MIKAIIFDFGNVFINLDIEFAIEKTLETLRIQALTEDLIKVNEGYETGKISTEDFIEFYSAKFPHVGRKALIDLWNVMLLDFPKYRLEFLEQLRSEKDYKLILLSNTNELHINWIKDHVPFYEAFKACFNGFYLSHEIELRKPNPNIYQFVLDNHQLRPENCLFVDDNAENIASAAKLNIHTWHITPRKEDVINIFQTNAHFFNV